MKKITSMLLLFLLLWGTGSVKAEFTTESVKSTDLKTGDQLILSLVPGSHSDTKVHYMCARSSKVFADTDANHVSNIWTLLEAGKSGEYYLYNVAANQYMGAVPQNTNTQVIMVANDANNKGTYKFADYGNTMSVVCTNAPQITNKPANIALTFWGYSQNNVIRWAPNTQNSNWTVKRLVKGDYYSNIPENVNYTRNDRSLTSISLNSPKCGNQTFTITPKKAYTKALQQVFKAKVGEQIEGTFNYSGWMCGYIYIDKGQDGQLDGDLMKASGTDGNENPGPFVLPAEMKPGYYYMRYKVDWDDTNPAGRIALSNTFMANGGAMCDVILHIQGEQSTVTIKQDANYTVTAENGSALTTAPLNQALKVKVTTKNHKFVQGIVIRHGYNLDGPQFVHGVQQYQDDNISVTDNKEEVIVNIPAEYMNADVQISAKVSSEVLIFSDEFNGANNSQPNPVWKRSPRWGSTWNRLSSKAEDVVYVQDGNLICRAIENEPKFDPDNEKIPAGDVNMRTGAIETSGKNGFNFRYGRVECRALANPFEGTFPAIWMMPSDGTGGWPSCGEIDIFELVNTENKAHHTIHTNWSYNLNHKWTCNEVVDYSKYHVYGLEWDDTSLKFMVDGKVVGTYNKSTNVNELRQYQWPYDRNFYLILNQSVGRQGDWAHKPDVKHIYEFKVDWIRVYQDPHKAKVCELRAAINKVKEYEEGAGMNQYTINHTALNAANEVLAAADTKSTAELQTAIESLKDVAILNQPKTNRFYRLRCADEKSQMKYIQSTQTSDKQNMKAYGDGKGVEGTFLYDGEGFVSYTQGRYCGAGALKNVGEKAVATMGYPINGRMGQYTVKVDNQFLNGKEATLSAGSLTNDYTNCGSNWWLEEVDTLQVTFNADATAAYATIYAPVALQCPTGITAYTGVKNGNTLKLTEIANGIIPARTGVLLKGAKEKAGVQKFKILYDNQENTVSNNDFIGVCASENGVEGKNYYVLGKGHVHTDIIGFYTHTGAANKVVKGFRARLTKENTPAAANSLRMVFDDDEVTGIEGVAEDLNANPVIYDLSGRRVAVPTKGLYIINGKKVYVK